MTSFTNNVPSTSSQLLTHWPPPARNGASLRVPSTFVISDIAPGQTVKGWTAVPAELVELLEDLDTACILAQATSVGAPEQQHWGKCIQKLRVLRQRLDNATPGRSVPLLKR
jgi:hypothetical protein